MEGLLLEPVSSTHSLAAAARQFAELRQKVAAVRAEVAALRRENLELRQPAGYGKGRQAQATRRLAAWEQEVEPLRGENRKLQAQAFGPKSERSPTRDRSHPLEGEADPPESPPAESPRRRRGPPRRDSSHWPTRCEERVLPPEQQVRPACGQAWTPSDTEDSEQMEIEVRAYRRRLRRRRYQRTCACRQGPRTGTAPPAPKLIPKGLLGGSVWVEILLDN